LDKVGVPHHPFPIEANVVRRDRLPRHVIFGDDDMGGTARGTGQGLEWVGPDRGLAQIEGPASIRMATMRAKSGSAVWISWHWMRSAPAPGNRGAGGSGFRAKSTLTTLLSRAIT